MLAKSQKRLKGEGFTLLEMLVVLGIIGILTTLTVASFRGNAGQRDLNEDVLLVMDGIKKVQTMALAGIKVNDSQPTGYAFYVSNCLPGSCQYKVQAEIGGSWVAVESVDFSSGLEILEVDPVDKIWINFMPPRANARLLNSSNDELANSEVGIKLTSADTSLSAVCINFNKISGKLSVVDCP